MRRILNIGKCACVHKMNIPTARVLKKYLTENETEAEAETKAETETETETVGAGIEFARLVTQKQTVSLSICSSAR